MTLTETPEFIDWPETHYVFLQRTGPFMQTAPEAWQAVSALLPAIAAHNRITRGMSLYRTATGTYRAGFSIAEAPVNLPEGLDYECFPGGRYSRFVMTGSYANLPFASARVWQIAATSKLPLRDDWAIENYPNDPKTTPESDLVTEILIPVE